jgi:hypothetical protein|eukprot:7391500-Prymnesium_polylepis.2
MRAARARARSEQLSVVLSQGLSEKEIKDFIAEVQEDTQGADQPLQMDARKGMAPQRAVLDSIIRNFEMQFEPHELELPIGEQQPCTAIQQLCPQPLTFPFPLLCKPTQPPLLAVQLMTMVYQSK